MGFFFYILISGKKMSERCQKCQKQEEFLSLHAVEISQYLILNPVIYLAELLCN